MNQREVKRRVLRELAGIAGELEVPPSLDSDDALRWIVACGDLYMELMRRAGSSTAVQVHVPGQLKMEDLDG